MSQWLTVTGTQGCHPAGPSAREAQKLWASESSAPEPTLQEARVTSVNRMSQAEAQGLLGVLEPFSLVGVGQAQNHRHLSSSLPACSGQ